MARIPAAERQAVAKRASLAAARKRASNPLPLVQEFGAAVGAARRALSGAKQRCTNPNSRAYANYGARGIEFRFVSVAAAVEWVLRNLGPRPSDGHSIDRIDNSRHYEPGNLRWATRTEQARNKRAYRRTAAGERIRAILTQRDDLTYETVRQWIAAGLSDEEILQRRKYARTSL